MATDRDLCKACDDLKYNATHFVANGLTDKECQSLMNNTGLDPKANHDDCEDLHNMQDCLMEGIQEDLPSYDDCDWKTYLDDMLTNLNTMLQAIVCVICGLWDEIARIWNKINQICNALNTLLALIRASSPRNHLGEWTQSFKAKLEIRQSPTGVVMPDDRAFPTFQCDILDGATCDSNKKIGRYRLNHYVFLENDEERKYNYNYNYVQDMVVGEVIGTIPMSAVVGEDMSEERWKTILKSAQAWMIGTIRDDTIVYYTFRGYVKVNGVTFNEDLAQYGQNVGVITFGPVIGPSRTGGVKGQTRPVSNYDA